MRTITPFHGVRTYGVLYLFYESRRFHACDYATKAHHAEKSSRKWQKNDKFCQPNNLRQPQAPYFRRKYSPKNQNKRQ